MNRVGFAIGILFGFGIGGARLNDYDVIHDMLLLREPEVFLLFGSAVAVALPLLWLLERRRWHTPLGGALAIGRAPVERRHIFGSVLFGIGWAVTGTCPGTALAMTASGVLPGLAVVIGLFAGHALRDAVAQGRAFRRPQHAVGSTS